MDEKLSSVGSNPQDILVSRKLGFASSPEYNMDPKKKENENKENKENKKK